MTSKKRKDIDFLLNHPKTAHAVSDVNTETIERRSFSPKRIKIFSGETTVCSPAKEYRFSIDKEARRLLPDIIDYPVLRIAEGSNAGETHQQVFREPRHIGVVFSGGPAPGGHNVIAGIWDEAKKIHPESKIIGFLMGPDGVLESRYVQITKSMVDAHRNMGGFSMIKTGRTKIDSETKIQKALKTCLALELDALVIIGGDDSNTNAAFLAQAFKPHGIKVIGVPKTIDGDIQIKTVDGQTLCAISFGFHSAAVAFSNNISHLTTDAASDIKYWHICKVMGRVASHLTLECAFQTHANLNLIGEELADYVDESRVKKAAEKGQIDYTAYGITLRHLSRLICDVVVKRAASGKNFGVMIIPEGILEFINEIQTFIIKFNKIIAEYNRIHDFDFHFAFPRLDDKIDYLKRLSQGLADTGTATIWNLRDDELFNQLPAFFQEGLLTERDTHGNFQFSQVKTEQIILDMVKEYLDVLKEQGKYKVGIERSYFKSVMENAGLDHKAIGKAIFKNPDEAFLLVKENIISRKTLCQALVENHLTDDSQEIPGPVLDIFKKSEPDFKTQAHFYGYDGRGSDPTHFDCNYTYNLGLTAFHLIANGATGQMAAIKNLEEPFDRWEPVGIPIAALMHLEERNGRLELVIEKSVVDLDSNAFRVFKNEREKWLALELNQDRYRRPGATMFTVKAEDERPITLLLNAL